MQMEGQGVTVDLFTSVVRTDHQGEITAIGSGNVCGRLFEGKTNVVRLKFVSN